MIVIVGLLYYKSKDEGQDSLKTRPNLAENFEPNDSFAVVRWRTMVFRETSHGRTYMGFN